MKRLTPTLWFLSTLTLLPACGGGSQFLGGKSNTAKGDKQEASGSTDDENSKADKPNMVAGAFLTCAYLQPGSTASTDANGTALIGCAVLDKNNDKIATDGHSFSLTLADENGKSVSMATNAMPASADWHVAAALPIAYESKGKLGMSVKDNASGATTSYAIATTEIRTPDMTLGKSDTNRSDSSGGARPSLKSFTADGRWSTSALVNTGINYSINPSDFCSEQGVILSTVPSRLLAFINSTFPLLAAIVAPKNAIENSVTTSFNDLSSVRFESFDFTDNAKGTAHLGPHGCMFVKANKYIYIISLANVQHQQLNFSDLKAFTTANQ